MTSATYGFSGAGPGRACTAAPESKPRGLRSSSPTPPSKPTRSPPVTVSWGTCDGALKLGPHQDVSRWEEQGERAERMLARSFSKREDDLVLDHSFLPPVQVADDEQGQSMVYCHPSDLATARAIIGDMCVDPGQLAGDPGSSGVGQGTDATSNTGQSIKATLKGFKVLYGTAADIDPPYLKDPASWSLDTKSAANTKSSATIPHPSHNVLGCPLCEQGVALDLGLGEHQLDNITSTHGQRAATQDDAGLYAMGKATVAEQAAFSASSAARTAQYVEAQNGKRRGSAPSRPKNPWFTRILAMLGLKPTGTPHVVD